MNFKACMLAVAALCCLSVQAQSYYPVRLEDQAAVYVTRGAGSAVADGVTDDTAALQRAIDKVQETTQQGVVFLPEGRYRLSHTLYLWPGVRLIGYGAHRPVLLLADKTPEYTDGIAYMVFFAGGRGEHLAKRGSTGSAKVAEATFPGTVPPLAHVIDANPGTFYSAISNVDFDMGEGNPGAVGIRMHGAQHCFLSHMEFRIRSGMAALNDVGNEAEDLRFLGGRYGIVTSKPSPGWQFTLLDSSFEDQREAAIKEHEAGLTLIRDNFVKVPAAIVIDAGYAEELWIKESRFEEIAGPAITVSNEQNPRTEINVEDVLCRAVPVFAHMRESDKDVVGNASMYRVQSFSHGLTLAHVGDIGEIRTLFKSSPIASMPPVASVAIRDLPTHTGWANLRDFGAVGDGLSDDTKAIRRAIDAARVVYLPAGHYRVSDTIQLKADTALIGLHPSTTEILISDEASGFTGPGGPKALLSTPQGGESVVSGLGLRTGGMNSRAVGALWMAGKDSLMDDVRFLGGHGTNDIHGARMNPYNANHSGDPDPRRRWDGEYPSLWVTQGGGGSFANIWTPNTYADAGMYVSDTSTEGHIYELSSEHHVRMEVKLDHVSHWELVALQTEEEHGEGGRALPLEISNSEDVLVANFHSYRVVGSHETFPYGVRLSHDRNVRFRNVHMDSDSKVSFNDAIYDQDIDGTVRFREFASLSVAGGSADESTSTEVSRNVRKLAGGFYNISGAALDSKGRLYFVDSHEEKIYRWSEGAEGLTTICDAPIDAANLFVDHADDLMAVSYAGNGTIYTWNANRPEAGMSLLHPERLTDRPGMTAVLPGDHWKLRGDLLEPSPIRPTVQYLSPDHTMFLPAGEDFASGELYYGTKMANVLRSFGLQPAASGRPFYVTDEEEEKTYSAEVQVDGTLSNLKLFANRGGEGVTSDNEGNVYLAAGQVFVYRPDGTVAEVVRVPERPIDLIVADTSSGRTLYILARTSLYVVDLKR